MMRSPLLSTAVADRSSPGAKDDWGVIDVGNWLPPAELYRSIPFWAKPKSNGSGPPAVSARLAVETAPDPLAGSPGSQLHAVERSATTRSGRAARRSCRTRAPCLPDGTRVCVICLPSPQSRPRDGYPGRSANVPRRYRSLSRESRSAITTEPSDGRHAAGSICQIVAASSNSRSNNWQQSLLRYFAGPIGDEALRGANTFQARILESRSVDTTSGRLTRTHFLRRSAARPRLPLP